MAIPSTNDFLARFPEFGEQSTAVVEGSIAEAGRSVASSVFGTRHTEGVSYLAAHILAMRTMQLGMQLGAPAGSPVGLRLDATLYGQEYQRLVYSLAITGFAF